VRRAARLDGAHGALLACASTGENKKYGEYLLNAQGEDVVAGIRCAAAFNASAAPS
jgi:hypothetical protein